MIRWYLIKYVFLQFQIKTPNHAVSMRNYVNMNHTHGDLWNFLLCLTSEGKVMGGFKST